MKRRQTGLFQKAITIQDVRNLSPALLPIDVLPDFQSDFNPDSSLQAHPALSSDHTAPDPVDHLRTGLSRSLYADLNVAHSSNALFSVPQFEEASEKSRILLEFRKNQEQERLESSPIERIFVCPGLTITCQAVSKKQAEELSRRFTPRRISRKGKKASIKRTFLSLQPNPGSKLLQANGFALIEVMLGLMAVCAAIWILFSCSTIYKEANHLHVEQAIETSWFPQ